MPIRPCTLDLSHHLIGCANVLLFCLASMVITAETFRRSESPSAGALSLEHQARRHWPDRNATASAAGHPPCDVEHPFASRVFFWYHFFTASDGQPARVRPCLPPIAESTPASLFREPRGICRGVLCGGIQCLARCEGAVEQFGDPISPYPPESTRSRLGASSPGSGGPSAFRGGASQMWSRCRWHAYGQRPARPCPRQPARRPLGPGAPCRSCTR